MSARRVVVVTGVARRGQAGETIAHAFAREGAALALLDRDADELAARADELRGAGASVTHHPLDLTDPEALAAAARDVAAAHGDAAHALVNVAGGFAMSGPVAESDPAVWRRMFSISLDTAYLATRAFLPALRRGRGAIVYFSSASALDGASAKGMSGYVAAKRGLLALLEAVAEEERPHGVRANAVAPTAIRTAANLASMGETARYVERESVADVVRWLCSDAARDVTGQVLRLG